MLTQVLAIPLADELPTPNARKTCALSIWLLQTQRLPSEVLLPSRDRIAYALRRGMEGELGKEGKKGSASDGLKVRPISFRLFLWYVHEVDMLSRQSMTFRSINLPRSFQRLPRFFPRYWQTFLHPL